MSSSVLWGSIDDEFGWMGGNFDWHLQGVALYGWDGMNGLQHHSLVGVLLLVLTPYHMTRKSYLFDY